MSANKRKIPGIFSWFGFDASIVERFQSIKDASFTNVSIWLGKEENAVKNVQLHEFSDAARISGLFIESAHAPFKDCIRMWSGSDSQKQELLTEYTKQIEFCSRNKIPVYVIHIAQKYNPPEPNEDGLFFMQELVKIA